MISNVDTIKKVNLHNQKFHRVEIIEVDDSDESNQVTSTTCKLGILLIKSSIVITNTIGSSYAFLN